MQVKKAILSRRAVREYSPEPIDEEQLRFLIDMAIQAPSAMNRQPWSFCVVRDQSLLKRISDESKRHLLQNSPAGAFPRELAQMLTNPDFQIFYHAPALIVVSGTSDDPWAQIDCALAAENLMLAATDADLGTCWIGLAQAWLQTDEGRSALQIDSSRVPAAPIIIGRPKGGLAPVPRRAPVISWIG